MRIRCSAIGQIMTGTVGLTDKQVTDLQTLEDKEQAKPLTAIQAKKKEDLIYKRDNPSLPKTAKTYCENWVREQLYDRRKYLSNKYLDKGLFSEDNAIDYAAEVYGWAFTVKNEEHFRNDFMQGTPDVILKDSVVDIKCSWDCFTFPLFDTEIPNIDYYWQLQGYMILTGKTEASLIYCLMDTPPNLIEQEARMRSRQQGFDELEESLFEEVEKEMTYSNLDPELRLKRFDISLSSTAEQRINERVEVCREYITNELNYSL